MVFLSYQHQYRRRLTLSIRIKVTNHNAMITNQNGQKSGMMNGNSEKQPRAAGMPDNQGKSVLGCILDRLRELSPAQLTTGNQSIREKYLLRFICTVLPILEGKST
jgi:hypothetical protein